MNKADLDGQIAGRLDGMSMRQMAEAMETFNRELRAATESGQQALTDYRESLGALEPPARNPCECKCAVVHPRKHLCEGVALPLLARPYVGLRPACGPCSKAPRGFWERLRRALRRVTRTARVASRRR